MDEDTKQVQLTWQKYPTGKIPPGTFCQTCGRYNVRCATTEVVVFSPAQKVLLIQRKYDPEAEAWAVPGGYVDWHESVAQAAARELLEETGVVVPAEELELIGVFDNPTRDKDGRENIGHGYMVLLHDLVEPRIQEETLDWQWADPANLPSYMAFQHDDVVRKAWMLLQAKKQSQ